MRAVTPSSLAVLVTLLSARPSEAASSFLRPSVRRRTRSLYSHPEDKSFLARRHLSRSAFLASLIAIPVAAHAASNEKEPWSKPEATAPREEPTPVAVSARKTTDYSSVDDGQQQLLALQQVTLSAAAREESISSFVAGAALTVTKTLAKYPLDTATVRLQMPDSTFSIHRPVELLQGCYIGLAIPLVTKIPGGAVFYSVKDAVKTALLGTGLCEWARTCIGVAAAQIPYWIIRNPSEVVRTRQMVGLQGYTESVSAIEAYQQVRDDRIRETNATGLTAGMDAYYSGFWENIYYAYPADVMKFLFYEALTQGRSTRVEEALAGAAATAISQFLTTPLDVVRNRVMADKVGDGETSYVGILAQIAKEEGLKGLFAGATPNVLKALISGAIQFATYEEAKLEVGKLIHKT